MPHDALLSLHKAGGLLLAYAHLLSMNRRAMLQKASEARTKLGDQLKAQELGRLDHLGGLGFGLSDDGNLMFD